MIEILNPAQIARARETGALVGDVLQALRGRSVVGTNLLDIDRWAAEMILDDGAARGAASRADRRRDRPETGLYRTGPEGAAPTAPTTSTGHVCA